MHLYRQAGFTLIELSIVIMIIGLMAAFGSKLASGLYVYERRKENAARLDAVQTALALFVAQNRRLPCPADGALLANNANHGIAAPVAPGACTVQQRGVVPWRTLGLPENALYDAYNRRISYRVYDNAATGLTRANGLDMSTCDPAATVTGGAIADCLTTVAPADFLRNKGLYVSSAAAAGNLLMDPTDLTNTPGGAAYVLISHGPNGVGAYQDSGAVTVGAVTPTDEAPNVNNVALVTNAPTGFAGIGYVDTRLNDGTGFDDPTHYDDIVRHPTILAVAAKAALAPRAP